MVTPKERIYWIDWAKAIAIILVVWAHISPYGHNAIFLFHMPLFFMISGYLYKSRSIGENAKSIFYSLILPYFIYNFLYILPLPLGGEYKSDTILNILLGNQEQLCYLAQLLWFVVSLTMMRLICMLPMSIELIGVICMLISLYMGGVVNLQDDDYFQWRTTLLCFPFFAIGHFLFKSDFLNTISSKVKRSILLPGIFLVFLTFVLLGLYNSDICRYGINTFHCRIGKSMVLFYMVAVVLSIICLIFCRGFLNMKNTVVQRISNGTLLILATHLILFWKIPHFPIPDYMQQLVCLLVIIFVSYWLIVISEKYAPLFIGKTKVK